MSDLLPCPFCGGKADIDYDGSVYDGTHVYCTECDIRTESYKTKTGSTWDVDAAIAAWNRRALPAVQPDDAVTVQEAARVLWDFLNMRGGHHKGWSAAHVQRLWFGVKDEKGYGAVSSFLNAVASVTTPTTTGDANE